MKNFYFTVTLTSILTTCNVNGLKIVGPYSNITYFLNRIALKAHGVIPNYLPDLTSNDNTKQRVMMLDLDRRRHFLQNYLDKLEKTLPSAESKEFISDDFTDYDEGKLQELDSKQVLRSQTNPKSSKKIKAEEKLIKQQHEERMKEIIEFMKPHFYLTKYLFSEVRRIKRDKVILDDLREMVSFVELPEGQPIKQDLLKCFNKLKKALSKNKGMGKSLKTNNLVINTIKDPMNYGFLN